MNNVLFFSRPRSEGWPHHGRTFSDSPFIFLLCHSDWLFHGKSYPRIDVIHPGRAWSSSPACTWHYSVSSVIPIVISLSCFVNSFSRHLPCLLMVWPKYASFLALTVYKSFLFTSALLRTHSFVFLLSTKPAESFSALSSQRRRDGRRCWHLRHLRSANCQLHRYRLNTYGRRAFSTVCNSLPDFIRDPTISADCFRCLLKTHLFARY